MLAEDHSWKQEPLARAYLEDLLHGSRAQASNRVANAVAGGLSIQDLYLQVFQWALYEIGRQWQENEATVAQEHLVTASTQLIMSQFYPQIFSTERCGLSLVAFCIEGDLHEVGMRMVCDFFELAGWDTTFLGASTIGDGLVEVLKLKEPDIVAISVTIKAHLEHVQSLIREIRTAGLPCKILVGGGAFGQSAELWKDIGADATASDAQVAVRVANSLVA